ncbi:hypothetical protein DM01DRAFT_327570 [Hesseltinella vesiculosa]|uniref:Uncharacterized protein n=1 Tax=Hesseltinella vesiculosa TaxID=101127 RepID=A0A1X2GXU5_9FUNG|nr:hypothetical protein DM01DRAFT_327570 [Hesseltinella vesiculosa]
MLGDQGIVDKGKETVGPTWMQLVDSFLEAQWQDAQWLMNCVQSWHVTMDAHSVEDIHQLSMNMMQRVIQMRQDLALHSQSLGWKPSASMLLDYFDNHTTASDLETHFTSASEGNSLDDRSIPSYPPSLADTQQPDASFYYQPPVVQSPVLEACDKKKQKRRQPPPRTRHRLAMSPSAPNLSSLLNDPPSLNCSSAFLPACTYNYYPRKDFAASQCRQCFFCKSTMRRQRSLSLDPWQHPFDSTSSCSSSALSVASSTYSATEASSMTALPASIVPFPLVPAVDEEDDTLLESPHICQLLDQFPEPPCSLLQPSTPPLPPRPPIISSSHRLFAKPGWSSYLPKKKKPTLKPLRSFMTRKFTFPHFFPQKKVHPMNPQNASTPF